MTTATTTLTEFLLARIAEDEAVARASCRPRPEFGEPDTWGRSVALPAEVMGPMESVAGAKNPAAATHIARHDPARVLAECEAKRRILAEHQPSGTPCAVCGADYVYNDRWPCVTVRALAAIYAAHPDYRSEWRL